MKAVNFLWLMMGLEYSTAESGKNCTDLTIIDGMTEMMVTGNCSLFEDCRSEVSSLPDGLTNGLSVDGPRNFMAETFVDSDYVDKDNNTYTMPGLLFTWKVPASATSRSGTKGYWLLLKRIHSAEVLCRAFDLSRYSLRGSPTLSFEYRLFPLYYTVQTSFKVQFYSLPPPSEPEMINDLYKEYIVSVPAAQNKTALVNSDQWTTWISLATESSGGSVNVAFGFADDIFGFEKYRVRLCTAKDFQVVQETSVSQVNEEMIGEHTFENIADGTYIISVTPEEVHSGDKSQCVCYSKEQFGRLCRPCSTSMTPEFEIKAPTLQPGQFTSKTSGTSHGVTSSTDLNLTQSEQHLPRQPTSAPSAMSSRDITSAAEPDTPVIVGAVVGGMAFVAACLFFGWWFKGKKHKMAVRKGATKTRSLDNVFDQSSAFSGDNIDDVELGLTPSAPVMIPPKRVLLLAAEDHEHHTEAVERFADFLSIHGRCIVSFAPQRLLEIHEQNAYCWLSSKIDQSDYILIITSKAAHYLCLAFQKGLLYRRDIFGPQGDLFTPGIQHICGMIARNAPVHHVLMLHFEYTVSDYHLPIAALPSFVYQLPKHLSSLLQHIHKLSKHDVALSKGNLPLECNVWDLLEGRLWMEAVQKAKTFEKAHPGWFEERFSKPVEEKSVQQIEDHADIIAKGSGINPNNFHTNTVFRPVHHALSVSLSDINRSVADDTAVQNFQITKDDFFEPSVHSTFTMFPTSSCKQEEINDRDSFFSAQLHRFNQHYEEQLHEQSLDVSDRKLAPVSQLLMPVRFSETGHDPPHDLPKVLVNHEIDATDSITILSMQSV